MIKWSKDLSIKKEQGTRKFYNTPSSCNLLSIDASEIIMGTEAFLLSLLLCLCLHKAAPRSLQWSDDSRELCNPKRITNSKNEYTLMHRHSICSPYKPLNSSFDTWFAESVARDADRYRALTATLQRKTAGETAEDTEVPLGPGGGGGPNNYIIEVGLGDSGQKFQPFVDTGSNLAWFPCGSCDTCQAETFNPVSSVPVGCSTAQCGEADHHGCDASQNTCTFGIRYGDSSKVVGHVVTDKLSLGANVIPNYVFGCARQVTGQESQSSGIIGLAKGSLSLISQTSNLFGNVFSYHLPSYKSTSLTGTLTLGALDRNPSYVASTPILTNKANPTLYYIQLKGVTIGTVPVNFPDGVFAVDDNTGGGIIIDSGTVISRFVSEAYGPFRDEFIRQMGAPSATDPQGFYDTCYTMADQIAVPQVKLMFEGGELALSKEQTVVQQGNDVCLAFALSPSGGPPISILGNVQQQDIVVTYDIPKSTISFTQAGAS